MSAKFMLMLFLVHVCAGQNHTTDHQRTERGAGRFRIISGRPADISEFPYQASMEHYGQQWCGGSILGPQIILTAAHCVQPIKSHKNIDESIMQIRVGNSISCTGGQVYGIEYVIPHERYNEDPNVDEFDIAVVVLKTRLVYSMYVQPIFFGDVEPKAGEMGWVTGFGRQDPMRRKVTNRHLMAVELPIMDRELCKKIHQKYGNVVTDTMICAGGLTGKRDSCKGDSGGPLAVNNKLVGVVAWGIGCGREGIPGVYTSVPKFIDWIVEKVSNINKSYRRSESISDPFLLRLFRSGHV